jgi:hypothetical protein
MRFAVACVGTARDYRLLARAPELADAARSAAPGAAARPALAA